MKSNRFSSMAGVESSSFINWLRQHSVVLLFLIIGASICASPLLVKGWYESHDNLPHLYRLFAVHYEMSQGDFYPRWLSLAAYGKGLPDLNFYSPGFYLLAGWLNVMGLPLEVALKAVLFAALLLGASGMFLWTRKYCDKAGALVAAIVYLYCPYHFLDLYVRGAFPEFCALALLPWLFYAVDLSLTAGTATKGIVLTAIASAAILVTHHLSAVMIIPFAALYFLWQGVLQPGGWRATLRAATGPILGGALSSFYWLPLITEMQYLAYFENPGDITVHFVYPSQWFSTAWEFEGSVAGADDAMSFQIGIVLIATVLAAAVSLCLKPSRSARNFAVVVAALSSLGLFLTTSYSMPIYDLVKPLQLIQFPWRFLGVATMFLAAFAGLVTSGRFTTEHGWSRWIIVSIVFAGSIFFSQDQRSVVKRLAVDLDASQSYYLENRNLGGPGTAYEFIPKTAVFDAELAVETIPVISQQTATQSVQDVRYNGSAMSFRVSSDTTALIAVPVYYFPGWKVEVDGVAVPVEVTSGGFISFLAPAGQHSISMKFGTTWPRVTGWAIALFSVAFLGYLTLPAWRRPSSAAVPHEQQPAFEEESACVAGPLS